MYFVLQAEIESLIESRDQLRLTLNSQIQEFSKVIEELPIQSRVAVLQVSLFVQAYNQELNKILVVSK